MKYYDRTVEYPGNSPGLRKASRRARSEDKTQVADMLSDLADFFEDRVSDRTHLEELMAPSFEFANQHDVPLYCGEFGVYDEAPRPGALRWHRDTVDIFADHDVSWSIWNYKGKGFGLVDRKGQIRQPELLDVLTQ